MKSATVARDATETASRLRLVVMRLARRLRFESLGEEVTQPMASALASVDRLGPLMIGELAAVEHVQPPTMTKIVAKLEATGFVAREADDADRRVVRVRATPAGRRYVERVRSQATAYLATRMRTFTSDERAQVEAALPLLERLIGDGG